jgi:hypothetical protein
MRTYFEALIEETGRYEASAVEISDVQQDLKSGLDKFLGSVPLGLSRLFCDDFRWGNMLANEEWEITLIDLEFTYTAPLQFLYSPPSWLIVDEPWEWGPDSVNRYKEQALLFIRILRDEENRQGRDNSMSDQMLTSLNTGSFLYYLALREPSFPERLLKLLKVWREDN